MVRVCLMALRVLWFSFYASGQSNWIFWRIWLNAMCSLLAPEPGPPREEHHSTQPTPGWRHVLLSERSSSSPSPCGVSKGLRICRSLWRISVLHVCAYQLPSLLMVALLIADALARLGHGSLSSVTSLRPFLGDGGVSAPFSWGCLSCPVAHPCPCHHPFS